MDNTLLRVFSISISGAIFWSCQDNRSVVDSKGYKQEESVVYQQLIDVLLDSAGFDEVDPIKQVFYVSDTLDNLDTAANSNDPLKVDIAKRSFSIHDLAAYSRHKFIKAATPLKLEDDEHFTGQRLKLSRIGFNEGMNRGFLRVENWCGFLCSSGYQYEIEKVEGKWRIKTYRMNWVS